MVDDPINIYLYRYAYFLYGLVRIARGRYNAMPAQLLDGAKHRISDVGEGWMDVKDENTFTIPVQPHLLTAPQQISHEECSVMMVAESAQQDWSYVIDAETHDKMLAVLDTGCTRTMHGSSWGDDARAG